MTYIGQINGVPVRISEHAAKRMVEMGLSPEQVKTLIFEPEETYESTKYEGDVLHRSGEFAIALKKDDDLLIVKTALYGTATAWLKAWKDGKLPDDRSIKDFPKNLPRW